MKVCVVIVNDHTRLGGPMGTESVSLIGVKVAVNRDAAKRWCQVDARKRHLAWQSWVKWTRQSDGTRSVDLGPVGYRIKETEVVA